MAQGCPITPFSPFTVALHNVRQTLLSKRDTTKEDKDIENALIEEILAFRIPIQNSSCTIIHLEFPIVAIIANIESNINLKYRGDFAGTDDRVCKSISTAIETFYNSADKSKDIFYLFDKYIKRFPFDYDRYFFPPTLREIDGYFIINIQQNLSCFVMFRIDSDEDITDITGNINIALNQFSSFLAEYASLQKYRKYSNSNNKYIPLNNEDFEYPILRALLSSIQEEINRIATANGDGKDESFEQQFKRAFNIVFIRPTVRNDTKEYCFKYFLTYQQIAILKKADEDFSLSANIAEWRMTPRMGALDDVFVSEIEKLIESRKEDAYKHYYETFTRFMGEEHQYCQSAASPRNILNMIQVIIKDERWKENEAINELLRELLLLYYAYRDSTIDCFLNRNATFSKNIESDANSVSRVGSFLITQILISEGMDVVNKIINHPLSKINQSRTDKLLGLIDDPPQTSYPPFLHLFETLVLSNRLFMYPLFQYGAPLLMCAFDDMYYSAYRSDLKSVLDKNIQGIFNSILEYELSETDKDVGIGYLTESEYVDIIMNKIKKLSLHFIKATDDNIEKLLIEAEECEILSGKSIEDSASYICGIISTFSKPMQFKIPKVVNGKPLLTSESNGILTLKLYLHLLIKSFERFFYSINLTKEKLKASLKTATAHTIKNTLSAQDTLHNKVRVAIKNHNMKNALLYSSTTAIIDVFLSMVAEIRQKIDFSNNNCSESADLSVGLNDFLENVQIHSTFSKGYFEHFITWIIDRYNNDIELVESHRACLEDSLRSIKQWIVENRLITNGSNSIFLSDDSLNFFKSKLSQIPDDMPSLIITNQTNCIIRYNKQIFIHLYSAFLEIFINSIKHETLFQYIDVIDGTDEYENYIRIQITAADKRDEEFSVNQSIYSWGKENIKSDFKLIGKGDGINIIRESLNCIDGKYGIGVINDKAIERQDQLYYNCDGSKYFFSEVYIPKHIIKRGIQL